MIRALEGLTSSQKFITLALAADAISKDRPVVFHYHGPNAFRELAKAMHFSCLGQIIDELCELEMLTNSSGYLQKQITSLKSLLEYSGSLPTGTALLKAVKDVLGVIAPEPYELSPLRDELQRLLSKEDMGSYEDFRRKEQEKSGKVTNAEIKKIIGVIKTHALTDIVPKMHMGEKLVKSIARSKIQVVRPQKGEPACFYVYEGNGRASVSLSDEHRRDSLTALQTLLHELYPGHHLYYLYRELMFNEGLLGEEATIDLLYSAETPVNEGIAETAFEYLTSLDEGLFARLKIAMSREQFCKKAFYNVWYASFVEGSMSKEEGLRYIQEQTGMRPEKALKHFIMIDDWRIYYPAYPAGREVVKKYMRETGENGLFDLYFPKTLSAFGESVIQRRVHEEESCETVLSDG